MKKLILSCLAITAFAVSANAQNPQVQIGATAKTYSVGTPTATVDPNGYTWSLNAAGSTAAPTFSASVTNSQSIVWSVAAPNVTITVVPKGTALSGGCNGIPQSLTIDVVATLSRVVTINTAASAVCPTVSGIPAYGDVLAPTFDLSGGAVTTGWTYSYRIDADATSYTSAAMGTSVSGVAANFPATVKFENTTAADVVHHVYITSWTVDGTPYTPTTPLDVAVTVHPAPQVGGITLVP